MLEASSGSQIQVEQGFHGRELYEKLEACWRTKQLLIICPPQMKDFSFLKKLSFLKIPDDAQLGVFTSGTLSGKPRLVFYTQENILSSLRAIRSLYDLNKIDQIFCYPQPTHTFGLTLGYIHSIAFNVPLIFHEGPYQSAFHEKWLSTLTSGTLTLGAPVHFVDLMHWLHQNQKTPISSYSAIVGGAPVSQKLWRRLQSELNIQQPSVGYGATEAAPGLCHLPPGVEPIQDGDIGWPLSEVQIFDVHSEGFQFTGPNLCRALLEENNLQQPQQMQIRDHLILDEQTQRYIFNGRSDLLINRGGLKYSPEVIESVIFSELGWRAVCMALYDERLGEDLGLIVEPYSIHPTARPETIFENLDLYLNQLLSLLKERFALKINFDQVVFAPIPLNENMKLDRLEAVRILLQQKKLKPPFAVKYLQNYLPHRSSAVWVDRLLDFGYRFGVAEVDLDASRSFFSEKGLRETACIEFVAQTYGFATAAFEIFSNNSSEQSNPIKKAQKTLIAEVRNVHFHINAKTQQFLSNSKKLKIHTKCTHDFGLIKLIQGEVYGEIPAETSSFESQPVCLAEVSLKAVVVT